MYVVYRHISPSGKMYIGITNQNPEVRWRKGKAYKNSPHFDSAIKKYGWEKFKHEILFKNLTQEEAEQKEVELIKKYNTTNRKYGYNCDSGGNVNKCHSEETKKKISESHIGMHYGKEFGMKQSLLKKGNKNRLGKHQTEETKRKISEKNKGKMAGEKNYFYSHKFFGKDNPRSRAVDKLDLDGNYIETRPSAKAFSDEIGAKNGSHITQVCKGKRLSAYGFKWRYSESRKETESNGMVQQTI